MPIIPLRSRWMNQLSQWGNFIHAAIFPPVCFLCGHPGRKEDICVDCYRDLPWNTMACPRCGLPTYPSVTDSPCDYCLSHNSLVPYHRMVVPFLYQTPIDAMIVQLKFYGHLVYAGLLGNMLTSFLIDRAQPLPDLLLPVPLHFTRLRKRGYNQAVEIARPIARRLNLPLVSELCQRVRATDAQSRLYQKERERNVAGAFKITFPERIVGKRIALLDDVVTTGYTVLEISRILRQAGAQEIEVWAIARTR